MRKFRVSLISGAYAHDKLDVWPASGEIHERAYHSSVSSKYRTFSDKRLDGHVVSILEIFQDLVHVLGLMYQNTLLILANLKTQEGSHFPQRTHLELLLYHGLEFLAEGIICGSKDNVVHIDFH